jgi:hypothetical protein
MSETILIVLGTIGLLAAGGGLGFWLAQMRMRGAATRADEVQQQFDDYRPARPPSTSRPSAANTASCTSTWRAAPTRYAIARPST